MSALLFVACAAAAIVASLAMSSMGDMEMPGGWTMSMMWMRMPGRTWLEAAGVFLGMWIVMMVAMMLPSLVLMLRRYREGVAGAGETRLGLPTALAGLGYFVAWTAFGLIAYPLGVALAALEMRLPALAHAVPILIGVVVIVVGALQFTVWKTRQLACCRNALCVGTGAPGSDARAALRHGLRLGVHCCYCCANLMAILLVVGVMDLFTMAVVTIAITAERLAADGERAARVIGTIICAAGVLLLARSVALG